MNALQAILMGIILAIVGAVGYVFYLFAGPVIAGLFVVLCLGTAYGVQYFFGNSSSGSSAARAQYQSKGAKREE